MVDQDILLEKSNQINRCLKRLREVTHQDEKSLVNQDIQDIFVLNLQRAIQSTIDLASHIVKDEKLGLPGSLRENFDLLYQNNLIDDQLCNNLKKMVGFRNIAVHEYHQIDLKILQSILKNHLQDLEQIIKIFLKKFKK